MFARVRESWRALPTWKRCSLAFMVIGPVFVAVCYVLLGEGANKYLASHASSNR